jgi:hypothetical protein
MVVPLRFAQRVLRLLRSLAPILKLKLDNDVQYASTDYE